MTTSGISTQGNGAHLIVQTLERMPELMSIFRKTREIRYKRDNLHILIVEDQAFSRKLMQEFLRKIATVEEAESVKQGLQNYMTGAPNIVFLDIELPDDNGHLLAHILKRIDSEAYVVMVTGNHTLDDVSRARSNNIDGYVIKPFNKRKLMECIDKYLTLHPEMSRKGIEA